MCCGPSDILENHFKHLIPLCLPLPLLHPSVCFLPFRHILDFILLFFQPSSVPGFEIPHPPLQPLFLVVLPFILHVGLNKLWLHRAKPPTTAKSCSSTDFNKTTAIYTQWGAALASIPPGGLTHGSFSSNISHYPPVPSPLADFSCCPESCIQYVFCWNRKSHGQHKSLLKKKKVFPIRHLTRHPNVNIPSEARESQTVTQITFKQRSYTYKTPCLLS